jgi:hypothetical protein
LVLVRPVDTDLGVEYFPAVERVQCLFGGTHVVVFDKAEIEAAVGVVSVWDDFGVGDGSGDGEDVGED